MNDVEDNKNNFLSFFQMKLPETFCHCMSLKTGGKVISVICTLTSLLVFLVFNFYIDSDSNEIVKEIGGQDQDLKKKLHASSGGKRLINLKNLIYLISNQISSCQGFRYLLTRLGLCIVGRILFSLEGGFKSLLFKIHLKFKLFSFFFPLA